ncbi:MAG: hypothetical protein ACYDDO_02560 [Acidiferrobacterales bacterium]
MVSVALSRYFSHAHGVEELYMLDVFVEGCMRSTVAEAVDLAHAIPVIENAVATNAAWKNRFASWAMKRVGAKIIQAPTGRYIDLCVIATVFGLPGCEF